MKSKLNKQQKKYIKACDSKELRKELKRFFKRENQLLQEAKDTPIVFKNGVFKTNNPFLKKWLSSSPSGIIKEKPTETPNANSLTKETLESLTNPDLIDKKKDFENAIEEFLQPKFYTHLAWNKNGTNEIPLGGKIELEGPFKNLEFDLPKTSQKIDELPNAIKLTYSREDMFKCFQESRVIRLESGFKFDSFASYLEYLQK